MVFEIIQIGIWFFDGQLETVSLFFAAIARSPHAALFIFLPKRNVALEGGGEIRVHGACDIKLSLFVF